GPPPAAIRAMGDKTAARRIARDLGVPMVAGTLEPVTSDADARAAARGIGYPLMIKAAHGGGGKGMRLVRLEGELEAALRMERDGIAAGERLCSGQAGVASRGDATEYRLNAEDQYGGWLPSPGTITGHRAETDPWVRDGSGVYEGYTVTRYYDTLLAKLIVWG